MIFDSYGCVVCGGTGFVYRRDGGIGKDECQYCSKTVGFVVGGHQRASAELILYTEGIDCEADLAVILGSCPSCTAYLDWFYAMKTEKR